MTNLKICRICLMQNVKMYKYGNYLKKCYDELVNDKVNESLPRWFCFECAYMLHKYHSFKQKCYRGLRAFKELLVKGPLTLNFVNEIDRQIIGLQSTFQLVSVLNNKVKTYRYKPHHRDNNSIAIKNDLTKCDISKMKEAISIKRVLTNERSIVTNFNEDDNSYEDEQLVIDIDVQDTNNDLIQENKICNNEINKYENNQLVKETNETLRDKNSEANMFKRSVKTKFLNPTHWKKISLTEDDAEKEFEAKAIDQKYLKARFKCSECYRGFSQEEMLKRHKKIKHCRSLGPFECRFCHMRVKWKSRLQKHLKEHFTIYKCLRCELSFSVEETAFKHDEFHNGVTRTCPHCGEQFRHSSTFYTHVRKHRSKHVCTLCGISFLSEFGLYMHKKVKHILTNTELSNNKESMFCEVCDIKFESREAYEEHLAQSAMHSLAKDEEDSAPQPLKWRYTQRRAPRKYTSCSICCKNFSTYVAYTKHHTSEHPDIPLTTSPYRPNIRKICEICGASVAPVSLASHINTHTREKRHACNICGTQLSSKSGLNRHLLIHTGEKPNKCNICDKRFAKTTNMKLHYRTVHLQESCYKKSTVDNS